MKCKLWFDSINLIIIEHLWGEQSSKLHFTTFFIIII